MSEELEVLKIVTGRLSVSKIPYRVTGSMAMNFYAMPRMTRDIDIVLELSASVVPTLLEQQFQEEFYLDHEMIQEAITRNTMFNMIYTDNIMKVDCILRKESDYQREAFSRRQTVIIETHSFLIITAEDLILAKLEWAKASRSEIQLTDIRNLQSTVEGLNHDYLRNWIVKLGLTAIYSDMHE